MFGHIKTLSGSSVQYISYTEPHVRMSGPAELIIAIAAWIAQQERIRLSERTGSAGKRAEGGTCRRPPYTTTARFASSASLGCRCSITWMASQAASNELRAETS